MSNQWYDKNEYENYPSYLMGKKKETDMGYGAPSPMNTPGNQQKFETDAWEHTTDVIKGEAEAYKSPYTFNNCRIRKYDFNKLPFSYTLVNGFGALDQIRVVGTSRIMDNNKLMVSVSVISRPEYNINGIVNVEQDGNIFSSDTIKPYSGGYITAKGMTPLGDAYVLLPLVNKYNVTLNIIATYNSGHGIYKKGVKIDLPYSK